MKHIYKYIFPVLFVLVALILLASTLKGNLGNPTPAQIQNTFRIAGNPFEDSPERSRYAQLMAALSYGSFDLPLQVAKIVVPDLGYINGKFYSVYPPGFLLATAPFYYMGTHNGMAQLTTYSSSILFMLVDIWLFISICTAFKIRKIASLTAAFLFLFATSSWAYSTIIYQYALELIFLLGAIRLALSKTTFARAGLIWFLAAYAFTIDAPNAIFVMPILLYYVFKDSEIDKKAKKIRLNIKKVVLYGFLCTLPVIGFWSFYNYKTYGTPIKIAIQVKAVHNFDKNDQPIYAKKSDNFKGASQFTFFNFNTFPEGLFVLTVSRDRGLLYYSPFAILSLLGISALYKKNRNATKMILLTSLTMLVVYAGWEDPWGGWAFGPRYLIPVFAILFIFLAQAIDRYRKNWAFLIILVLSGTYSIFVNALGALTTNQVPPIHEALGLHMKYNYFLNWDYLQNNQSGSFAYNTIFRKLISLPQYFAGLFFVTAEFFLILIGINFVNREKQ